MAKHIILIHGRATKPQEKEKRALAHRALEAGLRRIHVKAADALKAGAIKFTLSYYGDINNTLMVEAEPERKKDMEKVGGIWYEKKGSYDDDLDQLIQRPASNHGEGDYRKFLAKVKDKRAIDDVARFLSPVVYMLGLSEAVLRRKLPDLGAYLTSRVVGSQIRQRLQGPLKAALLSGDEVALISHSMGCIVSYDVLWKLSRMSEYRDVAARKVSLWVTIGSPLGEPAVKAGLYDAGEPHDGKYPTNVVQWLNVHAKDDFVAHDRDVADDFREMKERGHVKKIEDMTAIYNFWAGWEGSNPHKLYGYVNNPALCRRLVRWINA